MSMPRVPLPLPVVEPRCSSDACPRTSDCARRRANIEQGSPLQDYSIATGWIAEVCAGFVDLHTLKREAPEKPRPAAKPFPSD